MMDFKKVRKLQAYKDLLTLGMEEVSTKQQIENETIVFVNFDVSERYTIYPNNIKIERVGKPTENGQFNLESSSDYADIFETIINNYKIRKSRYKYISSS